MAITSARPLYSKRDIPPAYDRAWLSTEFGNIQRAILPPTIRLIKTSGTVKPTARDNLLLINATAGPVTVDLEQPARVHGLVLTIKKIDASANAITILGTVDGVVNPTITAQYAGMQIIADETGWWNIGTIP